MKVLIFVAMAPGIIAFKESPFWGVGPGNLRILCPDLIGGSEAYRCHPHPHNYFIQMMGEAGIIGLVTGVLFLWVDNLGLYRSQLFETGVTWLLPLCGLSHSVSFGRLHPQRTFSASGTISLCGAHFRLHWLEHRLVAPKALIQRADQSVSLVCFIASFQSAIN